MELKGNVIDLFDSIGLKSEILYNILKYIDQGKSKNVQKVELINYTSNNIKSKIS